MNTDLSAALAFFDQGHASLRDDAVPKGFFTARQIAEEKGLIRVQPIKENLDRLVQKGKAECRVLKIGRCRTAHYKILGC